MFHGNTSCVWYELVVLVGTSSYVVKTRLVLIDYWLCLENTYFVCCLHGVLAKHSMCLQVISTPWKTHIVLAYYWGCLESIHCTYKLLGMFEK